MESAGNDIVALCSINKERTHNSRFYRQILSAYEQHLFHASVNTFLSFDQFVWLAWSVKESAYKYIKRSQPQLVFSPTNIIIQKIDAPIAGSELIFEDGQWEGGASEISCYSGSLVFENNAYYFKANINEAFIASLVNDDEYFGKINWGLRKITSSNSTDQSKQVRLFLIETLRKHFPGKALQVSNSNGQYPIIMHDGKDLGIPVSFSHDNSFVSFAFVSP